jgi:hypothetical protein
MSTITRDMLLKGKPAVITYLDATSTVKKTAFICRPAIKVPGRKTPALITGVNSFKTRDAALACATRQLAEIKKFHRAAMAKEAKA